MYDDSNELYNALQGVKSRSGFELFMNELVKDYTENKETWDNDTLKSFLDTLHGFNYNSENDRPSWKAFAEMLYAARVYE